MPGDEEDDAAVDMDAQAPEPASDASDMDAADASDAGALEDALPALDAADATLPAPPMARRQR
jgi:hypothetical protein